MLGQCWVEAGNTFLAGITYIPEQRKPKAAVLIVPGFSQPACDVDYIMSRIARRLQEEGFCVLQLEPSGHGDSPMMLTDVTVESLRQDIQSGIKYIKSQLDCKYKIFGVGRGLSATLLAETDLTGVAGISPYCLSKEDVSKIWNGLDGYEFEIVEKAGPKETLRRAFFDAMGSRETNIYGQCMSSQIIEELKVYDALQPLKGMHSKGYWIFYDKEGKEETEQRDFSISSGYCALEKYADCCLPRVAIWQNYVIENIVDWISQSAYAQSDV